MLGLEAAGCAQGVSQPGDLEYRVGDVSYIHRVRVPSGRPWADVRRHPIEDQTSPSRHVGTR
jgi:hypothetical protein